MAKMLSSNSDYLNYDRSTDRIRIKEESWDRTKDLVIFDEIHKMENWKRFIKGIYDTEGTTPPLVVTGSARMDTIRKTGDSLAGRFFPFRLHPLDVKEAANLMTPDKALNRIMKFGGFPEPFLENDPVFARRWRRTHLDIILRQDLIDLESVRDIQGIETLIELLRTRVGSTVSYSSLARDLERDHKTVKSWLTHLENLFVIFPVRPWHKNIARAILKEPKYYFFDTGLVKSDQGAILENTIACSLQKELDFITDTEGYDTSLHFVKNKEGKEIDFAIAIDSEITRFIEVKTSDDSLCSNFSLLPDQYNTVPKTQLVKELRNEKTFPGGEEIRRASDWLAEMDLRPEN